MVKHSLGQRAARSVPVLRVRGLLREAAMIASSEPRPALQIPAGPFHIEFDLSSVALADQMAILPPAMRCGPVTVAFDCRTMAEVVGWMTALSAMSFAL